MYYVTIKQSPVYHQIDLDEFLFGDRNKTHVSHKETTDTRTRCFSNVPEKYVNSVNTMRMTEILEAFISDHAGLYAADRMSLYREFYIPKRSGGFRKIDAPNDDLADAIRELKLIFEKSFGAGILYHTSAFAYMQGRCTLKANDRHIENKSEWYAKLDLSNFFGSTTKEFVMKQLSMIFPFCEVCRTERGYRALATAIDLCFLNGGLPQGTSISPLLTNIIMIPIDFTLCNQLADFNGQKFVYTRYADDFTISSKYKFNVTEIIQFLNETLKKFDAPYVVKPEKTRYGSASGRNWNLGVMITKDKNGDIIRTIGSRKKRQFEAQLSSFVLDTMHGNPWASSDVCALRGYINYYRNVEGETIDRIITHIGDKYGVNILQMIREQLA